MDLFSIKVDGHEVLYRTAGTRGNPPLLLLHGWGASSRYWEKTAGGLLLRHHCIMPDLPGFGLSDKPRISYSIENLTRLFEGFLDRLELGTFDLVGHSMGSLIAMAASANNPDRVRRLCVVNPPFRGWEALSDFHRFSLAPGIRCLMHLVMKTPFGRKWIAKDFTHETPLDREYVDDLGRPTYRSGIQSILSLIDTDSVPTVNKLKMPVLLISTDRDKVIDPGQQKLFPEGDNFRSVLIKDAGHIPMIEKPEEFLQALSSFLVPSSVTASS
jgi:pimeloyl-ACP methyl ester carboxylesterase